MILPKSTELIMRLCTYASFHNWPPTPCLFVFSMNQVAMTVTGTRNFSRALLKLLKKEKQSNMPGKKASAAHSSSTTPTEPSPRLSAGGFHSLAAVHRDSSSVMPLQGIKKKKKPHRWIWYSLSGQWVCLWSIISSGYVFKYFNDWVIWIVNIRKLFMLEKFCNKTNGVKNS